MWQRGVQQLLHSAPSSYLRECELVYDREHEEEVWCTSLQSALTRCEAQLCKESASAMSKSSDKAHSLQAVSGVNNVFPTQCPPPRLRQQMLNPISSRSPLRFSAAFESGNLGGAWLAAPLAEADGCDATYELVMQPDTLSNGHVQWFFFAAEAVACERKQEGEGVKPLVVRMRLLNFKRDDSLFSDGLVPAVWDAKCSRWRYDLCYNVEWKPGPLWKAWSADRDPHYALSFTYSFQSLSQTDSTQNQPVYFAYGHPYTFSFLCSFLQQLESDSSRQPLLTRQTLTSSSGGKRIHVVEVNEPVELEEDAQALEAKQLAPICHRRFENRRCPAIVIIARQHPGEPQGSWIVQGLMEFLSDPKDSRAQELRKRFSFRIIPMLNVDGVIVGNSRCSATGLDLNRQWRDPSAADASEVHSLRSYLAQLQNGCYMVLDVHGHSAKRGIFFYGCRYDDERPYRQGPLDPAPARLQLLAELAAGSTGDVCLRHCRSSMPAGKRSTARCALFAEAKARWVYTVEASMHATAAYCRDGAHPMKKATNAESTARGQSSHVNERVEDPSLLTSDRLVDFGRTLGATILDLSRVDAHDCRMALPKDADCPYKSDDQYLDESDSGAGSDICPSDDNISPKERQRQRQVAWVALRRSTSAPQSRQRQGESHSKVSADADAICHSVASNTQLALKVPSAVSTSRSPDLGKRISDRSAMIPAGRGGGRQGGRLRLAAGRGLAQAGSAQVACHSLDGNKSEASSPGLTPGALWETAICSDNAGSRKDTEAGDVQGFELGRLVGLDALLDDKCLMSQSGEEHPRCDQPVMRVESSKKLVGPASLHESRRHVKPFRASRESSGLPSEDVLINPVCRISALSNTLSNSIGGPSRRMEGSSSGASTPCGTASRVCTELLSHEAVHEGRGNVHLEGDSRRSHVHSRSGPWIGDVARAHQDHAMRIASHGGMADQSVRWSSNSGAAEHALRITSNSGVVDSGSLLGGRAALNASVIDLCARHGLNGGVPRQGTDCSSGHSGLSRSRSGPQLSRRWLRDYVHVTNPPHQLDYSSMMIDGRPAQMNLAWH
eukprot:TRINITY_DN17145_c0_g1_i1.p1 TRINITY_DN17145_c0_g1~~TRINITY_DN17145_c0_g1_i1.p1  ORF type:complete len:1065 (-),score=74.24 TRINITY_DN17145_c0_g1_i1:327-3521(-)